MVTILPRCHYYDDDHHPHIHLVSYNVLASAYMRHRIAFLIRAVVVCGDFNARPGYVLDAVLKRESMCNAYSTRKDSDVLDSTICGTRRTLWRRTS